MFSKICFCSAVEQTHLQNLLEIFVCSFVVIFVVVCLLFHIKSQGGNMCSQWRSWFQRIASVHQKIRYVGCWLHWKQQVLPISQKWALMSHFSNGRGFTAVLFWVTGWGANSSQEHSLGHGVRAFTQHLGLLGSILQPLSLSTISCKSIPTLSNSIKADIAMYEYHLLSLLISGLFFCQMLIMTPGKVSIKETYKTFDVLSVIKSHLTYLYTFPSFGEQLWGNWVESCWSERRTDNYGVLPSFCPFYHSGICN